MSRNDLMRSAVLHIPHSSRCIPGDCRKDILLSDEELDLELLKMTDAFTNLIVAFFAGARLLVFPVSRLVVDVERFRDDKDESMAEAGMGAVYTHTHDGRPLRSSSPAIREDLLGRFYDPHHKILAGLVGKCLRDTGRCLILDIHSFSSSPLPYERAQKSDRPDICLGGDPFHTPGLLLSRALDRFGEAFERISVNSPFSGAIVPLEFFRKDRRVSSLMIEINRQLLMDENTGEKLPRIDMVFQKTGEILEKVLHHWACSI